MYKTRSKNIKNLRSAIAILLVALMGMVASETYAKASYSVGEKAYLAGDYEKAIDEWERLLEEEGTSAGLLYDMGNAYCASGNLGFARLYYERARKLDPSNKAIEVNLAYVSSKVEDANKVSMQGKRGSVEADDAGFIGRLRDSIAADHTSNYWALFAVMAFVLTLGSIALYLFPANIAARKVGFFSAIIFIVFCVVFITFSILAKEESNNKEYGVVMAYKIELQTEPQSDSKASSQPLTHGTKVRIIGEESDVEGNVVWFKVRLNSNYQGWIPSSDLEVI